MLFSAFKHLLSAIEDLKIKKPRLRYMDFHTDQESLINDAKIPTAIIGPGNSELAHCTDEYVLVDQVKKAAKLYLKLIVNLLV